MTKVDAPFEWAIVGAGPAGIAALGKLLDHKIKADTIAWLDPSFSVGDFANKWRYVSSNTKVELFNQFLFACQSFQYASNRSHFALQKLQPEQTCELHFMAEPLQWITEHLKTQVHCQTSYVTNIKKIKNHWQIQTADGAILDAKKVILAPGAVPKTLALAGIETITLDIALNKVALAKVCTSNDTIAVFGSSHSAILIIRYLLESTNSAQVINFYRSPLCYAIDLGNEILFDNTGLKGTTADWARENIDGTMPEKLLRVLSSDDNIKTHLGRCHKAIYAIGFEKRPIAIEGFNELTYNDKNGIIAPGLFGLGIAFPEAVTDRFGAIEYRVGLWKFMDYLTRILPLWLDLQH
jgi:thioredoxin reductase